LAVGEQSIKRVGLSLDRVLNDKTGFDHRKLTPSDTTKIYEMKLRFGNFEHIPIQLDLMLKHGMKVSANGISKYTYLPSYIINCHKTRDNYE
jgi:hypothetical protein